MLKQAIFRLSNKTCLAFIKYDISFFDKALRWIKMRFYLGNDIYYQLKIKRKQKFITSSLFCTLRIDASPDPLSLSFNFILRRTMYLMRRVACSPLGRFIFIFSTLRSVNVHFITLNLFYSPYLFYKKPRLHVHHKNHEID